MHETGFRMLGLMHFLGLSKNKTAKKYSTNTKLLNNKLHKGAFTITEFVNFIESCDYELVICPKGMKHDSNLCYIFNQTFTEEEKQILLDKKHTDEDNAEFKKEFQEVMESKGLTYETLLEYIKEKED